MFFFALLLGAHNVCCAALHVLLVPPPFLPRGCRPCVRAWGQTYDTSTLQQVTAPGLKDNPFCSGESGDPNMIAITSFVASCSRDCGGVPLWLW